MLSVKDKIIRVRLRTSTISCTATALQGQSSPSLNCALTERSGMRQGPDAQNVREIN